MNTSYPFAPHVEPGDFIVTSLSGHPEICYVDRVTDVWHWDETYCIKTEDGETRHYSAEDIVTIVHY